MTGPKTPQTKEKESSVLIVAEQNSEDSHDEDHGTFSQLKEAFENKNIGRVLLFSFIDGGGHSIWNRQVFQVLIYQVAGDKTVGWMSGFSGFSQMIAAVIAGFVGDHIGRELVLKAGCAAGLIAVVTTMWGVGKLEIILLYFGQVMWGCYGGIASTGTEAIFADSVSTGQRAYIYNLKWMVQSMSSVVGVVLTMALLVYMGNEWQQPAMKKTMYVGLCYHVMAMLMLLTLKQKYAVGDQETSVEAAVTELAIMEYEAKEGGKCCPEGMASPLASQTDMATGFAKEEPRRFDDDNDESRLPSSYEDEPSRETGGTKTYHDRDPLHGADDDDSISDSSSVRREGGEAERAEDRTDGAPRRKRYHVSTRRTLTPSEYSLAAPSTARDAVAADVDQKHALPLPTGDEAPLHDALHITTMDGKDEEFIGEIAMIRKLNAETDVKRATLRSALADLPSGAYLSRFTLYVQYLLSILTTWECVPYFVCAVDFLVAIGSGMTMRYLSLFFVAEPYNVGPALLMSGELIMCPLQAIFSYFVQQMGSYYTGRLPATVIVRGVGTTLLLLMGITHNVPLWLIFPVYIVRNSLMNSTAGITRSVIMDAVKKENRAKWSAFESFSSFTWAGSAVIGGYIAEAHGHQFTFAITAVFHYLSLMVLIPAMIGAAPIERQLMHFNKLKRDRLNKKH